MGVMMQPCQPSQGSTVSFPICLYLLRTCDPLCTVVSNFKLLWYVCSRNCVFYFIACVYVCVQVYRCVSVFPNGFHYRFRFRVELTFSLSLSLSVAFLLFRSNFGTFTQRNTDKTIDTTNITPKPKYMSRQHSENFKNSIRKLVISTYTIYYTIYIYIQYTGGQNTTRTR